MGTSDYISIAFGILFVVSEALGNNPKIKANSVFQFIQAILSKGTTIGSLFNKKQ